MLDENIPEGKMTSPTTPASGDGEVGDCDSQVQRWLDSQQWPTADESPYESPRASIDAIAHELRRQHLRPDEHLPTHSSDLLSLSLFNMDMEVDPMFLNPPVTGSPPRTATTSVPPTTDPSALTLEGGVTSPNPRDSARLEIKRVRRKISSKFYNRAPSNQAMQTLVEDMVHTGTQCDVRSPPVMTATNIEADHSTRLGIGGITLEVDENLDDDAGLESPLVERLMEIRRGSGSSGISKGGFPLYRSSTESALRCQNLVRNRPRMRKRTKIREKSSLSAMSAASGLTAASASTS